MQRSSVVLPDPLGPTIETFSPRFTSTLTPDKTSSSPNFLCKSTIRRSGSICPYHTPTERDGDYPVPSFVITYDRRLEAMISGGRLVIRRPIDADARILLRRDEPGLVAHAVGCHRLHVDAVLPNILGDDLAH